MKIILHKSIAKSLFLVQGQWLAPLFIVLIMAFAVKCEAGGIIHKNKKVRAGHTSAIMASPPAISYGGSRVYTAGTTIAPLVPVNNGGAVDAPGYNNANSALYFGFNNPYGVAANAAGDVYVADYGNGKIYELPAAGGAPVEIGSGFSNPAGIALDAAGNIYIADVGHKAIKKIPAGGGSPATVRSGFNSPVGIAVDAAGNVYVADNIANTIYKVPAGGGSTVTVSTAFSNPEGIAVDVSGNIYVADASIGLREIPAGGGSLVTLGPGLDDPAGVAVDAGGNLFVTNSSSVYEIAAGTTSPVMIGDFLNSAYGVTTDGAGNVYMSDNGNNVVYKIYPTGGYYVSPNLPAGLSFSTATGTISGTPVAASPAANYTVTAYNADGQTSANVNITVNASANALLTKIAVNSGTTLTTVTGPGYRNYTTSVPNSKSTIAVTAVTQDAGATIKINGVTTASNTPSAAIPLAVGNTTINTVVTAADGVTTKTYIITVTRAAAGSTNALLSKIATNTGVALTQVTGSDYRDYTISVPNTTATVQVTATTQDATATVKINGVTVASGTPSANIPLAVGNTVINTVVTAQDGVTVKTYGITITRAPAGSTNAVLSKIATNTGVALTQVTGSDYRDYAISVPNSTSTVKITATAQDATAAIKINGVTVTSGTPSASIPLAVGNTVINTVVTAQDGVTTKTYGIAITRAAGLSNNALLSKIATNSGVALTQVSGTDYRDYTISVPNTTSTITITPTVQDATATVKVNGITVASGTASAAIPLQVGNTVIATVVTAQDGTTTKTYGITVTRAAMMALYVPKDNIAIDGLIVHPGITPNGDGVNDIFNIDGINAYPDNKVTIMGRSGAVVYEAKGYDNQTKFFDGHSSKNGALQLPGTYFYSLEYEINGRSKVKTGFLVLKY